MGREKKSGVDHIDDARRWQLGIWDLEHDDQHTNGELVFEAIHRASRSPWDDAFVFGHGGIRKRIEGLAKAGALLAAEIDRLERIRERVLGGRR